MNRKTDMMKLSRRIISVMAFCSIAVMTGCVYDDIDGCPTRRYVQIRYDNNLKSADAASSEVKSVKLYAADENGTVRRANVCTRCIRSNKVNRAI